MRVHIDAESRGMLHWDQIRDHEMAPTFNQLITMSGKTMTQIAAESGLSLATISKIAKGTRKPSVRTLCVLTRALGANLEQVAEAVGGGIEEAQDAA